MYPTKPSNVGFNVGFKVAQNSLPDSGENIEPVDHAGNVGFGAPRGRDVTIIVGCWRFRVHSVIVGSFLNGKVFDTLVEQAYANINGEVVLWGDNSQAWQTLLEWIYKAVENPLHPWSACLSSR